MHPVEERWFRQVLQHVPTAVVVISGVDGTGAPVGFACGSFFSVSLDPPLVGFCVARTSTTWPRMAEGGGFCANVLADDQEETSGRFARSGGDKFAGVEWHRGTSGRPYLDRAVAWVDCATTAVHEAGDHLIVVGTVAELLLHPREPRPLVFHRGGYGAVAETVSTGEMVSTGEPAPAQKRQAS
ncbi:flavin reductase family protein [Actinomadura chibensis]|uniref:Flavin reductase family protein n=1 Tax=Actinomadura chibensis TaxID=392828 RepID=A0A5D0NA71_9ACTN|nr:flavin reductase family protein [Actinomadura chibensis]TYB41258.1 flavin reductase family protein [Actinomadura chibensis]